SGRAPEDSRHLRESRPTQDPFGIGSCKRRESFGAVTPLVRYLQDPGYRTKSGRAPEVSRHLQESRPTQDLFGIGSCKLRESSSAVPPLVRYLQDPGYRTKDNGPPGDETSHMMAGVVISVGMVTG